MFPDVSCEYVVGAEKIFPVCTGDGGGQSVGRGGQYLLEPGVGGITHELQNEPFAGGEEGAALAHPGQRHQPVHLAAAGGGACVHAVSVPWSGHPDTWQTRQGSHPLVLPGCSKPIPHAPHP